MRKPNKELVEPLCVDAHPAVWYMYKYLSIHLFDLPRAFARAEDGQTLLATYVAWTPTDLKGLRTTVRPFLSAKIYLSHWRRRRTSIQATAEGAVGRLVALRIS